MTKISEFCAGRTPPELYEEYLVPGLFTPWADEMTQIASPGQRVLDLACGTGILARRLFAKHGATVQIDAIDVAGPMLAVARKNAPEAAAVFHESPADALSFDDSTFDIALCQQGVQFFPDPAAVFTEVRRVLKPGGAFAVSVWSPVEEGNPVFASFAKSIGRRLGDDLLPLGPFAFGDGARLRMLAEGAGFAVEILENREKEITLPPIEPLVLFDILFVGRPALDGSLAPAVDPEDPAGDEVIDLIIADMKADLARYETADGRLKAPIKTHFLIARR